MYMRIVWGKIVPGKWDEFEAAFKAAMSVRGELKGLKITTEYEAVEDAASAARTEAERAGLPTIGGET